MEERYKNIWEDGKILLSVIVPVYNCEKYIAQCLESLTKQNLTKEQYEVLVINDGSTDKTAEIVLEYCEKYDYFTLISQENKGVSGARNLGIDHARGKYISFVDADDLVAENLYVDIIHVMERDQLSGFYFGHTCEKEKLERFDGTYHFPKRENACKMSVCRVIFLKDIILEHHLRFQEDVKFYEDFLFNYKYVNSMKTSIASSGQCLYYVRMNDFSATAQIRQRNKEVWLKFYNSLVRVGKEIKQFTPSDAHDNLFYRSLSSVMTEILWTAMIYKIPPRSLVKDLEAGGLSLKDIKFKCFEGKGFKYWLKSWLEYHFRCKFIFYFTCFLYRILK